jgi:Ras-related protein Rab-21
MGERFKVFLLGEGRAGKTSILLRYTMDKFSDNQQHTVQASHLNKKISINNHKCSYQFGILLDRSVFMYYLDPMYYRDAAGTLSVFDITDQESFNKVRIG